jgi:Ser/Thr protein kinase RdoA (MazF antagonist)
MLWESEDPVQALRDRFGFDGLEDVGRWVAATLLEIWVLRAGETYRVVISDQNAIVWVKSERGDVVVKWSRAIDQFPALNDSTEVLRAVAAQGIPVAGPVETKDGRSRVVVGGPTCPLSVAVLPVVTGDWLDVSDAHAVFAAGACLAHLHHALTTIKRVDLPAVSSEPTLVGRIRGWLAKYDHGLAPDASRRLSAMIDIAPALEDPLQLVHRDFRAANILTSGSRIVAVLDFDDIMRDHRVNDLAHSCVYLGTLFTNWQPTSDAVRRRLIAGYESVRPLSSGESQWLEILMLWQGLIVIPGTQDKASWIKAL